MPVITRIVEQSTNQDRLSIFIDGQFCVGIRKRTFQAMNLVVGDEISCAKLKEDEKFFWKKAYQNVWEQEKVRINRIKKILEEIDPRIRIDVVGFGADSNEIIKEHPDERGAPDLNLTNVEAPDEVFMKVEVTGSDFMRGEGYWVRPDKIEYAKNHPEQIVWTALHYAAPDEIVRFIRHIPGKEYNVQEINIRGAGELMCMFKDSDEEVLTLEEFRAVLTNLIN